jgi:thiosulfate reductase cytochrome b subunit
MQTHTTSIDEKAETAAAIHPAWLRVTHWLNVLAVLLMVTSGWRIYNAAPFWPISFPKDWTLGGWLGGALQWHFAGMWLLVINGLLYVGLNLGTGRWWRKFLPLTLSLVLADLQAALRGRLSHADLSHYNGLQKAAYLFTVVDLVLLVASGLVLWKSVQFPVLRDLLGGYDTARRVHFIAMGVLLAFVAGHVFMVALVPRTLLTMIRGR